MSRQLATALDDCLERLRAGDTLALCLRRYPELADELEPLLSTAARVKVSYQPVAANDPALVRARNRVLAEASRRQQVASQPRRWRDRLGLRLSLSPGLATTLITLVVVFGILGGGGIVSANSLPGDALYGVKRASESVRLALTTNQETKLVLEQVYSQRRLQEAHEVVAQRREARIEFAGMVSAVEGQAVVIEGLVVTLPEGQVPAVGDVVEIVGETSEDGQVQASEMVVQELPDASSEALGAEGANQPTPEPTNPPKATETPLPSSTPTESPTATVEATETEQATVTQTATATESPTLTPSPTYTLEPTPTPPPPPREVHVRIEGRIDEISGSYWRVAGKQVFLNSTHVDASRANAQVGGRAVVDAVQLTDGGLEARSITVLSAPEAAPTTKEFSGRIDSIDGNTWIVGGRTVDVSSAEIEGQPEVGARAIVKADEYSDGRLVAKRITVKAAEQETISFGGVVQSISGGSWVVAGQRVTITADTKISGDAKVGSIAEVKAIVQPDGSRVAIKISVKAPPEPTPEPTVEPTASPEPEPTATPEDTMGQEPTATPEDTVGQEATATPEGQVPPDTASEPTETPVVVPQEPTPTPEGDGSAVEEQTVPAAKGSTGKKSRK